MKNCISRRMVVKSHPSRGATGNWWLLGKAESIFFADAALRGCPRSSRWFYIHTQATLSGLSGFFKSTRSWEGEVVARTEEKLIGMRRGMALIKTHYTLRKRSSAVSRKQGPQWCRAPDTGLSSPRGAFSLPPFPWADTTGEHDFSHSVVNMGYEPHIDTDDTFITISSSCKKHVCVPVCFLNTGRTVLCANHLFSGLLGVNTFVSKNRYELSLGHLSYTQIIL